MKITKLTTKDGAEIDIGSFTVLVGPNNVGKSQTLRDIHQKMLSRNARTTIVTRVELEKPKTFEDLFEGLEIVEDPQHADRHQVKGIQSNLTGGDTWQFNRDEFKRQFDDHENLDFILGNLSRFRVSYLDAASRLRVAESSSSYNPHTQPPQNLLQGLFGGPPEKEAELRDAFKRIFGMDIRLDYSGMTQLNLRVAREFGEIPEDPRKAYPIFREFSTLDTQGDGFRSFVGVVLSLLLSKGRIILLDEPEAFLHPAQARQLGLWIAQHTKDSPEQIIVATHNANFLAGILSSEQSVDIFRLNREGDVTTYTLISSEATSNLAKSPILSSQRVLEAIFYRGVVVCEADADRAVYQTVATKEHDVQDILFIHAHNKQTIPRVVLLLKNASIPVCAIADIDVLNSASDLENILKALGDNPDLTKLLDIRNEVSSAIDGKSETGILDRLKLLIEEFLAQLKQNKHTLSGARGALNRIRRDSSKWNEVKRLGVSGMSSEVQSQANDLISLAKQYGLFVVPVGELESWLDLGTSQKNKWIVLALESLHTGQCSEELGKFVGEALEYIDAGTTDSAPLDNTVAE
jgi:ABC-type branched-subunit amino acid transport system ATPase component